MNDNSFGDNFGPSTPGAMNVISGDTYGAICGPSSAVYTGSPCTAAPGSLPATPGSPQPAGTGTNYGDADPNFDICSATQDHSTQPARSRWGARTSATCSTTPVPPGVGFRAASPAPATFPASRHRQLSKVCTGAHKNIAGATVADYIPHHEPFQYFASTANPQHLPPTSVARSASTIRPTTSTTSRTSSPRSTRHAAGGVIPESAELPGRPRWLLRPARRAAFHDHTINDLEQLPSWSSTAVVIAYDDSDGWYDHQIGPIFYQSQTSLDTLTDPNLCGSNPAAVPTNGSGTPEQARCGFGPRLPLLVISPSPSATTSATRRPRSRRWSSSSRTTGSVDSGWDSAHTMPRPDR